MKWLSFLLMYWILMFMVDINNAILSERDLLLGYFVLNSAVNNVRSINTVIRLWLNILFIVGS